MSQELDQTRHDNLLITARNLAIVHNLLNQGLFQGSSRSDLSIVVPFVEEMHKNVMAELEPMMALKEKFDEAMYLTEPVVESSVVE